MPKVKKQEVVGQRCPRPDSSSQATQESNLNVNACVLLPTALARTVFRHNSLSENSKWECAIFLDLIEKENWSSKKKIQIEEIYDTYDVFQDLGRTAKTSVLNKKEITTLELTSMTYFSSLK